MNGNQGMIMDICRDKKSLNQYFHTHHPMFNRFSFGVMNAYEVYIVNFDKDQGQGGYFAKDLTPVREKKC